MQGACRHTDDPDTQASMHEGVVQIRPFVGRHTTIFPGLAVEHEVRGGYRTADDGGAIEELLRHAPGIRGRVLAALLHIGAAEGLLEDISSFDESCQR